MSGRAAFVDLEPYEGLVVAARARGTVVYLYPFVPEAFRCGMRVLTRDGRVVKRVRVGGSGPHAVVVGILDGEELRWDRAGRFSGPYRDDPRDLFVPERYMYTDWKETISMSNGEWAARFGKAHPGARPSDAWDRSPRGASDAPGGAFARAVGEGGGRG